MRALFITALIAASLATSARADCTSVEETIQLVEANGHAGAFAEGAIIPLDRVDAECLVAMADALAALRLRKADDLIGPVHTRYRHWLYWEEAQWAGRAQLYERASDLTRQARAEQHNQPDAYFDAYIAFFDRDRPALRSARDRLGVIVQQRYYSNPYATGVGDALLALPDGLDVCWERPFAEAALTCTYDALTRIIRAR